MHDRDDDDAGDAMKGYSGTLQLLTWIAGSMDLEFGIDPFLDDRLSLACWMDPERFVFVHDF